MFTRRKGIAYEFRCAEADAIARKLMWNNIAIISVILAMVVLISNWFSLADKPVLRYDKFYSFYLIGYCVTFGGLNALLFGVISIRSNDRFKRTLKRFEDWMFALK